MRGTASATTVTSFVFAHMDGPTQVCSLHAYDALNTFLLNVANDVLERGGTHREF
jgi:hypothetical protein